MNTRQSRRVERDVERRPRRPVEPGGIQAWELACLTGLALMGLLTCYGVVLAAAWLGSRLALWSLS